MRKLTTFLVIIAVLIFASYILIKAGELLRDTVLSAMGGQKAIQEQRKAPSRETLPAPSEAPSKKKAPGEFSPGDKVALYFKDGSTMIGELVEITKDEYIINWKGQETIVFAHQVERIGSPKEALQKQRVFSDEDISEWWPFENDIAVRLTNSSVLDAKIKDVGEDRITLLYLVDGGSAEQDIERSKVEHLIFKPVENKESQRVEKMLKELFPKMKFHKFGNFTIVSDSDILWIKECSQVLKNAYTNIYFKFFDLLKDRKPQVQNYVVIFDSFIDFVEYAVTDGVPGWMVAGYFSPEDKVLYLFNILGKEMQKILFEAMVGESGRKIDEIVENIDSYYDDRYNIFIEGEAKAVKDKYWEAYSYYKNLFREATLSTLRHEFTHQIFYNWGLQNIVLSEARKDRDKLITKKKEFLETEDYNKKAEIVKSIISMRGKGEALDMKAANSWLAEGMATYCEVSPIGSRNDQWLFLYQKAAREKRVNPIEALTVYKMGSFPGVYPESMLYMYAQSWAYVHFLMDRYPKEFMEYQRRMAKKAAEGQEDINWLLECVGKDLRTLDAEFAEYMNRFEELEDPFSIHIGRLYSIFQRY